MREMWRGDLWAARPMICARDDDELAMFWFPRGTTWKRPSAPGAATLRMPKHEWQLVDDVWDRNDNLITVEPGAAHAVHLFFGDDGLKGWYVNLQEPLRRTAEGFDYMDHALDIVIAPDLSEWGWKDEHDLAEFVARGLMSPDEARAVRAEGERVLERMQKREGVFGGDLPLWRPNPAWSVPRFP